MLKTYHFSPNYIRKEKKINTGLFLVWIIIITSQTKLGKGILAKDKIARITILLKTLHWFYILFQVKTKVLRMA